jgi:hypothetical protein
MSNPWIFMGVDRAHFFGEVAVHTDEMLASLNQHFGTDKLTILRLRSGSTLPLSASNCARNEASGP